LHTSILLCYLETSTTSSEVTDEPPTLIKEDVLSLSTQVTSTNLHINTQLKEILCIVDIMNACRV